MFDCLGGSGNGGRRGFDDLGRLIGLLDLLLLGFFDRGGGICSRVLERSHRGRLLKLWGSFVNLGRVANLPSPGLEKIVDTSGQTAAHLGRRLDELLVLFLFLLGLLGSGLRDRSLGLDGSGGLGLLDWLRGSVLDSRLGSGSLLRLCFRGGGLLGRSRGFLGRRSGRLKQQITISLVE